MNSESSGLLQRRHIFILVILVVPLIGLSILSYTGPSPRDKHHNAPPAKEKVTSQNPKELPLDKARILMANRLKQAESMTQDQFVTFRKHHSKAPTTLEEYRAKIKDRVAHLQSITPEQWEEEKKNPSPPSAESAVPVKQQAPPHRTKSSKQPVNAPSTTKTP
jgi:flagellar basal body-associated protein FliL